MSHHDERLSAKNVRLSIGGLTEARYDRVRNQYDALKDVEIAFAGQTGAYSAPIVRDIWTSLYNPAVPVDKRTEGEPIRRLVDWAHSQMQNVPGYPSLAADSSANVLCSTLATRAVVRVLQSLDWPPPPTETERLEQEFDDECETTDVQIVEGSEGSDVNIRTRTRFRDGSGESTSSDKMRFNTPEEARKFVDEYLKQKQASGGGTLSKQAAGDKLADFEERIQEMLDGLTGDDKSRARALAREEVEDASEEARDLIQGVTTAYGMEQAKHVFKDPSNEDLAFVRELAKGSGLASFLKIVGRFMKSMRRSRVREKVPGNTIPIGVTRARDVRHLLPIEAALLAVPSLKAHQTARVLGRQAAGYRTWDYSSKGNGPVHVALDISGSMTNFTSPEGVLYGNAFAAAACLYAVENRRPVTCSVFDTSVQVIPIDAKDSAGRIAFLHALLDVDCTGGTDFRPLIDHVETLERCDDVLLISDGVGSLDEAKTRKVFRSRNLNYLVVGQYDWCAHPVLREISGDRAILASSLLDDSASSMAAKAVARR
jgi:polyhydroxyalkanoate synthesis regulator phasin